MIYATSLLFLQTTKDAWDRASVIATILLVIVGALTLVAVWRQAKESAKATVAMEKSVAAFIKSQRPQLALEPAGDAPRQLLEETPRVTVKLTNVGLTTAYDCTYESWIEVLPSPSAEFTSTADYFAQTTKFALPTKGETVINLPIRSGLTNAQKDDLRRARAYTCFRVRVEFSDSFSTDRRYASFGMYVMYKGLGYLPKYNDAN